MKLLKTTDWENTPIDLDTEVKKGTHKGRKINELFCPAWETADPFLDYAILAVKNPLARLILQAANRICDGIYARNCGAKKE